MLGPPSGIARYVKQLANHLAEDNEIVLSFNRIFKPVPRSIYHDVKHSQVYNNPYPYKVIRRLLQPNMLYSLPYDLFAQTKSDLYHGTNYTYQKTLKGKSVITIHDLAYMRYPESTSDIIYKHHSKWTPYSAAQCDFIIADSIQTKQDIVELLNIPDKKIEVIYLAADDRFQPLQSHVISDVMLRYNLPDKYILFVGTVEPRKNLLGFMEAYKMFRKKSGLPHKLVIVGAKGWKSSPIYEWTREQKLSNDIIFTGYIDDNDLPAVYNGASLFVMPSIYEGFGLPILEAMGCGIPVMGSNVSSIPELIKNYGVLIDPYDQQEWANQLERVLSSSTLLHSLSTLSLERAGHFNWAKTASETRRVYEKLL
nr:glycosyltransferase family 1 protein [Paenibacillus turpanensis]